MTKERMQQRIKAAGLTQTAIARRLGVTTGAVSQWLSGTSRPSLTRAAQIERLTGIPASEWVADDVDKWLRADAD